MKFDHIDESEFEDYSRVLAEAGRAPDDFNLSEEADASSTEEMRGVFVLRATATVTCKASGLSRTYRQYGTAWLATFENDLRAGVFDRQRARLRWWLTDTTPDCEG